jgi:hypothetical protein
MIIGSMTLLSIQFSLQYSFSILTTCAYAFVHTSFVIFPKVAYVSSLTEKIKQKKTPVVYETDKIANLHGHEVLRTPVRHCELNPIELMDFSEQASIDFQTTQERQNYSSPGDSHHPLIRPETLNRSHQSKPHQNYILHNTTFPFLLLIPKTYYMKK